MRGAILLPPPLHPCTFLPLYISHSRSHAHHYVFISASRSSHRGVAEATRILGRYARYVDSYRRFEGSQREHSKRRKLLRTTQRNVQSSWAAGPRKCRRYDL